MCGRKSDSNYIVVLISLVLLSGCASIFEYSDDVFEGKYTLIIEPYNNISITGFLFFPGKNDEYYDRLRMESSVWNGELKINYSPDSFSIHLGSGRYIKGVIIKDTKIVTGYLYLNHQKELKKIGTFLL